MDIHFEVSNKVGNRILDAFDCSNFANCFHDIAHAFPFDFNDHIIKTEQFVGFRNGGEFADFA